MSVLVFGVDGTVRGVHSDAVQEVVAALGPITISRASHVEPNQRGWWVADMAPMGGPKLMPCRTRSEALSLEVDWLTSRL